jgi:hypothetical protein
VLLKVGEEHAVGPEQVEVGLLTHMHSLMAGVRPLSWIELHGGILLTGAHLDIDVGSRQLSANRFFAKFVAGIHFPVQHDGPNRRRVGLPPKLVRVRRAETRCGQ